MGKTEPQGEPTRPNRRQIGHDSEVAAAEYLRRRGYQIVATNVRLKTGELDIVAEDRGTLVLVEVRARRPSLFATAAESVVGRKGRKVLQVASEYLQKNPTNRPVRIDVVAITLDRTGRPIDFELITNALEQ